MMYVLCYKAMPTHFINGNCHIEKLKGKSPKTYLTNHTESRSCHWLLIPSGWTDIHVHTNFMDKSNFKNPGLKHEFIIKH